MSNIIHPIQTNTIANDPRIVNLTPYTLDVGGTIIPFSNMICVYHKQFDNNSCPLFQRGGPPDWTEMLDDSSKTFIVTENVGLWISKFDKKSDWKGRVVGPENLIDEAATSRPLDSTSLTIKILPGRKWVMYKDVEPPLKEVVFNPDPSSPAFTIV